MGVENPVFLRRNMFSGNGGRGLRASEAFARGDGLDNTMGANFDKSVVSTRGTRTSSECAMLAQSVSLNN